MNRNSELSTRVLRRIVELYSVRYAMAPHHVDGVNKRYEDTMLRQTLITNADSKGMQFDIGDVRPERLVKVMFVAISAFLSKRKVSKNEEATAFVILDLCGNFKFAAIVEYHMNETNPDEPGNWSYSMTFNESDLAELEKIRKVNKFLTSDDAFRSIIDKAAYDIGGFTFDHETIIYDSCNLVIDAILQVLDSEAKEGETVEIELPGYVTVAVAIEDGEKVYSITPNGHLKYIIKSDVDLDADLVPPEDIEKGLE